MEGWAKKQVQEFCYVTDFVANGSFAALKENVKYLDGDGFAVLVRLTDHTKNWNGNYRFVSEHAYDFLRKSKLFPNDLVMSNVGEPGKVFIVPNLGRPMTLGPNSILIRPDKTVTSEKFLYYYFSSPFGADSIERIVSGTTQNKFNKTSFRNIEIPVPPLPEQHRIVTILNEAFDGIGRAATNAEKNLANARELFESYLNAVFTQKGDGWEDKTLKQVSVDFGRGKSKHRPRNDPKLYGGPYPFIQTGDVRNCDHIIQTSTQSYNETGLAQSKLWPQGTICITIAANIAETGILGFDACFPDSIIGILVDQKQSSNDFVEYLLQSVKTRIKAKGKGSAQDNINLATFENEHFSFPTLDEQNQFVVKFNKLSTETIKLEAIYQMNLTAFSELKQSILQKAFSGELTAQPNQAPKEAVA